MTVAPSPLDFRAVLRTAHAHATHTHLRYMCHFVNVTSSRSSEAETKAEAEILLVWVDRQALDELSVPLLLALPLIRVVTGLR
jgi:hypothetical protein